jgi:hypothetical protein
VLQALLQQ